MCEHTIAYALYALFLSITMHYAQYSPYTILSQRPHPLLCLHLQLHLSLTKAMNAILRREGVAGLYRGAAAMAIGAGYVTFSPLVFFILLHSQ